MPAPGASELTPRAATTPVYELHHLEYRNAGDRECVPLQRFWGLASPTLERHEISYHSKQAAELENELVVLGGGGVLNPFDWPKVIVPLLERGNRVMAWAIGHHHDHFHFDPAEVGDWRASIERYEQEYALERLWIASVRDAGTRFEYVPCSSCMSEAFDGDYEPRHKTVIYGQGALDPIEIDGLPTMLNTWEASLEEILAFLGSAECVITNSYHGAYWATLLGRRVLVYEPWCSKWLLTPWPLTTCNRRNWRRRRRRAKAPPAMLADARGRNRAFAARVFEALAAEAR